MALPPRNSATTRSRFARNCRPTPESTISSAVSGVKNATTIAMPPRRGTGRTWTLRVDFAWSNQPSSIAWFRTRGVSTAPTINETRNATAYVTMQGARSLA